jgi:nuclease-like protein
MSSQSPLKAKPLRVPGQSLDEQIDLLVNDRFLGYGFTAACFLVIAGLEWIAYLAKLPRHPIPYSVAAAAAIGVAGWRFFVIRQKVRQLRLGRDGERVVGQFLERLRNGGCQVFHDVPGDGFNLDHVIISPHGLYAIETKTWSKSRPKATITVEGDTLRAGGRKPDCDPIAQVTRAARWLECELEKSTGKRFAIRGVVVFPGWFVDQRSPRGSVWVLEPKALPAFIERQLATIAPADVALASYHLSRYVRSKAENAA